MNSLIEAVLSSTHNLCFEQKYEKYQNFLSENFHFSVVKFSVHLNRCVFVMSRQSVNFDYLAYPPLYVADQIADRLKLALDRPSKHSL